LEPLITVFVKKFDTRNNIPGALVKLMTDLSKIK